MIQQSDSAENNSSVNRAHSISKRHVAAIARPDIGGFCLLCRIAESARYHVTVADISDIDTSKCCLGACVLGVLARTAIASS